MQTFQFIESYGKHSYTLTIKLLVKFDPTKHFPEGWVGYRSGDSDGYFYPRTDETIEENMAYLFHRKRAWWLELPKSKKITDSEEIIIQTLPSADLKAHKIAEQKWLAGAERRAGGSGLNIFRKL